MGGKTVGAGDLADIAEGLPKGEPEKSKSFVNKIQPDKLSYSIDRQGAPSAKATFGVVNVQAGKDGVSVSPNRKPSPRKDDVPVEAVLDGKPIEGRSGIKNKVMQITDVALSKPYVKVEVSASTGKGVLKQSEKLIELGEGSGDVRDGWVGIEFWKKKFSELFGIKATAQVQVKNITESTVTLGAAGVAHSVAESDVAKKIDPDAQRKRMSRASGGETD